MSITSQHVKEDLCLAHVSAISAIAGILLEKTDSHDYGIDGRFNSVVLRGRRRISTGFPLEFQAKSTINWELDGGHIVYDLESKTYNDLVSRSPAETALILVLLCLPKDSAIWHSVTEDRTILQKCCYWHRCKGDPLPNENSTKRIRIPSKRVLTPDSLRDLLAAEKMRREGQVA